jgi:hypothetical protein
MAVQIKQVGVEIPGRVMRPSYDEQTTTTTLVLDEKQVSALHEQLDTVMSFFSTQNGAAEAARK